MADPSSFTFVQHGEPVHVRYAGAPEVQVNIGATVSDTDVVPRYPARDRVVAALVTQEQVPTLHHHRAEQVGARIRIVG